MNKKLFKASANAFAVAGLSVFGVSCGNNKYKSMTEINDSAENGAAQTEQVAPLEAAKPSAINNDEIIKKYNADFFNNESNKGTAPSADKWAETASGLKYALITPGEGASPSATSEVTVHYTGYLANGNVFDSSVSRGEPTSFPLNQVIRGWTEGLQLMKPGGLAVFCIPGELAYGEQGQPAAGIGSNETLYFAVELLSVNN